MLRSSSRVSEGRNEEGTVSHLCHHPSLDPISIWNLFHMVISVLHTAHKNGGVEIPELRQSCSLLCGQECFVLAVLASLASVVIRVAGYYQ
jgi:hypothetical protein